MFRRRLFAIRLDITRPIRWVVDVIMGALPQAVTAAANGSNTSAMFYGRKPGSDSEYVYFETLGGGGGARHDKRGKDGVVWHLTVRMRPFRPVMALNLRLVDVFSVPNAFRLGDNHL